MKVEKLSLKFTLLTPALATSPGDKDIYKEFIGSRAPTPEAAAQEAAAHPATPEETEEVIERGSTVYLRDEAGNPLLWDYQVKGTIKARLKNLIDLGDCPLSIYRIQTVGNEYIHVFPRQIQILKPDGTQLRAEELEENERPLRAKTMQGDRVALVRSEQIPAGCWFTASVHILEPMLKAKKGSDAATDTLTHYVLESLKLCVYVGIGCWRSAGWGRMNVELLSDKADN